MINQTEQTLYRLSNLNAEQSRISYQTSTGEVLENGSDDSTLYSREILIDDRIRTYEGIKLQIERTTVQNNAADSAISEIKKIYEVIKTELIKANTDTTSEEGKKSIALNIEGMKDNILTLANTQIEDEYLFAGSDSSVKPFSEDVNGNITYIGDNSARKIAVDDGTYRDRGVNGYEVMTYPSNTATMGETFNFKASDIIIDEDGSLWKLNATNTAIEKYDKEDKLITPLETKSIDSNDGLTPATYQIDNISSDSGTKFEARTSIFDLIDDMVNTLNKVDSDGSAITDEQRDALLGEQQSSFSDAYDSLNVTHTNLGSINAMFESSLESVSSKLTQYNILSEEVGSADLTKLALESKSLEITYTALYSTIQKTNELSLANFL